MKDADVLARLVPETPAPLHVVGVSEDGLSLSDGSLVYWPEDDTRVILAADFGGDIVGECWPGDEGYDDVIHLIEKHRGPHEIKDRPRLRVFRGEK